MTYLFKRCAVFLCIISLALAAAFGQAPVEANSLDQLDSIHRSLATQLAAAINSNRGGAAVVKVAIGNYLMDGGVNALGGLWSNSLQGYLIESAGRTYSVLAGPGGHDLLVQGEIINLGESIRIYTRLIRASDNAMLFSRHQDLAITQLVTSMLSGELAVILPRDQYEPNDSMEAASPVVPGQGILEANFHNENDVDWYRFSVSGRQRLQAQTYGGQDTLMELYDRNGNELYRDDDSGSGYNAKIEITLESGEYYLKVWDYDQASGDYSIGIAFVEPPRPDSFEPDDSLSQAKPITIDSPQQRNFHEAYDEDWARLVISRAGRYGIRARSLSGDSLDTYMELYDAQENLLDSNDDGGDNWDAYLEIQLQPGTYYIRVHQLAELVGDDAGYELSVVTR